MSIHTVTTEQSLEPISLAEARDFLRQYDPTDRSIDDEIVREITAAREYCEDITGATFRTSVARQQSFAGFPDDPIYLDYPPLLTVASIQYYDTSNNQQTLDTGNYSVVLSTANRSYVEWTATAVLPAVYSRSDAVDINYTTGYASNAVIPAVAKRAIKMWLRAAIEDDPGEMAAIRLEAIRESMYHQLAAIDPGTYR
jgi:uncharacterized phiE125 gp8 family phage protein